jgi:tRNA A-37 threonylcarbamoyl transferase component Bud32
MFSLNIQRPEPEYSFLLGFHALHDGYLVPDALTVALPLWAKEPSTPLAQVLLDLGQLNRDGCEQLERLVEARFAALRTDYSSQAGSHQTADESGGLPTAPDTPTGIYPTLMKPVPSALDAGLPTGPSAGRYTILRSHARGGLGEVYVAQDAELRREVALKEMRREHADDPLRRRRFVLEAEVTGSLEHPGVVPVYGLGCYADGRPYYAMRFVKGDSLQAALERYHAGEKSKGDAGVSRLALRQLLRRFVDVCNTIGYAHSRGLLHRDLKPSNVMLGDYGETLVVDWGLAKTVGTPEEGTLATESGSGRPLRRWGP